MGCRKNSGTIPAGGTALTDYCSFCLERCRAVQSKMYLVGVSSDFCSIYEVKGFKAMPALNYFLLNHEFFLFFMVLNHFFWALLLQKTT